MSRRKRQEPKTSIVAVVWHDAHDDGSASWVERDQIDPDPYMVVSVGILLPSDTKPNHVSVARSIADVYLDHILHIPTGMIQSVTVLGCLEDFSAQE
jgi:hypothetical protein